MSDTDGSGHYAEGEISPYEQLDASDTLDTASGVEDPLDTGYSPPDYPVGVYEHGTTPAEQRVHETIDERIRQEVPDPTSAYGAPSNESGYDEPRVGGDDPDSIDAEDDWLGDEEVGDRRSGRLVAPDEGLSGDHTHEMYGTDVGIDGGAASAEEAAMHVIDGDEDSDA